MCEVNLQSKTQKGFYICNYKNNYKLDIVKFDHWLEYYSGKINHSRKIYCEQNYNLIIEIKGHIYIRTYNYLKI